MFFEVIKHAVTRTGAVRAPMTIEWDFADTDPWHLRVDNGSTRAAQGHATNPTCGSSCSFEDWVDVVAAREDPRRAMLRRKIKPHGSIRTLLRTRKLFAR